MIKAIVSDFSRTLLFPVNHRYTGSLNELHAEREEASDYRLEDYFSVNEALLTFYKRRSKDLDLYLFTTGSIQEVPVLKKRLSGIFKKIFTVKQIDCPKDNSQAYKVIAKTIGVAPSEILFVDDNKENIKAAKRAGLHVVHFQEASGAIGHISRYL